MKYNTFVLLLFFCFHMEGNSQHIFEGKFSSKFNGDLVLLEIMKTHHGKYIGKMNDSQQNFTIDAEIKEGRLIGIATENSMGVVFNINGSFQPGKLQLKMQLNVAGNNESMELLFERVSTVSENDINNTKEASNTIHDFTFPEGAALDPSLIGVWTKNENYNSGSGDNFMGATYSECIVLFKNGTVGDGGNQATISGDNYFGQSESGFKALPNVFWYNISNQLYVVAIPNGKAETSHLGKYYIEDGKMLITSTNGNKMLLLRR